tara:strand:+ start:3823 stop:4698 length:876 start_codon:yes stop_codon:yes gene_type:complete
MSKIIDGAVISKNIKEHLYHMIKDMPRKPGLGIILVGEKEDSKIYVKMKHNACKKVGINNYDVYLPEDSSEEIVIQHIEKMNNDINIDGILIQLPLPGHLNRNRILNKVSINKDVDGFHVNNMGKLLINDINFNTVPCTPLGCLRLIKEYSITIEGKEVVIIGCGSVVGLPLSLLLLHRGATVTICHDKTKDIYEHTKKADILICATGNPRLVNGDHIKEGVVIIDIGISKVVDTTAEKGYRIVGDVDYDSVIDKVSMITPVPGGVGPMTIAMLLEQTVKLSYNNQNIISV